MEERKLYLWHSIYGIFQGRASYQGSHFHVQVINVIAFSQRGKWNLSWCMPKN